MSEGPYDDPFAADDPFDEDLSDEQLLPEDAGVEELLQRAIDNVASSRRAPFSASVVVARDEVLYLLQTALDKLPDELRQARWLLREREEFLAQRKREADDLVEEVRAQAERMVQRTEIVRQANQAAKRTVEEALQDARRLRHEAEDYCDQKLAAFEIVLDRTMKTVQAGRERLQATPAPVTEQGYDERALGAVARSGPDDMGLAEETGGFFDQDSP